MPDTDPFDLAAANRVAQRVEGITDEAEDLLNPDLFEHVDQDVCYHLSHLSLPRSCDRRPCLRRPKNRFRSEFGARPSFQGVGAQGMRAQSAISCRLVPFSDLRLPASGNRPLTICQHSQEVY